MSRFMPPARWGDILRRTVHAVYEDDCFGLAAELAYFWFLALFPALLFVVALAGYVPVQHLIDIVVRTLERVAPRDVLAIVREQLAQITHRRHAGLLALSLLGALWTSSSGMTAIIDTLNQAYHVKDRRAWWRVRALAIALTLALATLAIISVGLALVGPRVAHHIATRVHLGPAFAWTWKIAQWPLIFGLIVTALEWIYYFAPDVTHRWGWITPGSVTATALGLLLSLGLSWYAGHFGDYQRTYGTIGGVIVALLWLYGSGLAILIGAELNAAIERAAAGVPAASDPSVRP
ncbi:MAG TPA: YihY/virulence factor BrkB family protein [Vicinamibacterales bacterium]|nr:YihY/virulence factor BrkB family protein [Vicinamibacterales bacterium]